MNGDPKPPTKIRRLALGASGGRRILPAVTQILSFVMDYGMDLNHAIHQPRARPATRRMVSYSNM